MSTAKRNKPSISKRRPANRGILARPLDSLIFLLPFILFYEAVSLLHGGALMRAEWLVAHALIRRFIELFGYAALWAPAVALIVILLATHAVSGERWVVHWRDVGRMYLEAPVMAVPLLLLNWAIPLQSMFREGFTLWAGRGASSMVAKTALGIGAGLYEELVFRLILITLVVIIGCDLLRLRRSGVAVAAILLSSLAFAAHHHRPIGVESFQFHQFTFRALAGGYLAVIFWYRGYGPAAGCHAAYNVALVILRALFR